MSLLGDVVGGEDDFDDDIMLIVIIQIFAFGLLAELLLDGEDLRPIVEL